MRVLTRMVRGRKKHPNWSGIVKEVERTIDSPIKKELLTYPKRIVAEWSPENRPGFKAWKRVTPKGRPREIAVGFYATGGKGKDIWGYVSKGTRPHIIRPRNKKALYFRTGYQPRTRPGGQYRGPGEATGEYVFAQEVQHPGTKAREFEKHIARWYGPKFRRHIENAMRRGARRA